MKMRTAMIALFIVLVFALGPAVPVYAASFTVNTAGDTHDANTGNGSCADAGGNCSLRAAIEQANALSGGTHTITVPANTYNLTLGELPVGSISGQSISISGAGSGTTIIHQTQPGSCATSGTGCNRVFDLDSAAFGNITVVITGLTISGGIGANYGGGGILGGWTGDSLTVTNCIITNNSTTGGNNGGGISWGGGGNLTIQSSTISNNIATQSVGGGIAFINGAGNPGNLTISNSTISGNIAGAGIGAGQGGGIFISLDTGSTASISGSMFTSNAAQSFDAADPGRGGAVYHASGALTITGTTFSGNSATTSGGGNGEGGAIYSNSGVLTADNNSMSGDTASNGSGIFRLDSVQADASNNWWGCNAGPGNSGCDTISGNVNYTPWINPVLTVTRFGIGTVTAIPVGGSSDTLSWVGNTGTAGYLLNTQVNVAAVAGAHYIFNGWSGACSGNGSPCSLNMDSAKSVTATFYYNTGGPCVNPPFMISGIMYNDASIQEAYTGLASGQILEIRALDFTEALGLVQNNPVSLSGGYSCDFSSKAGFTTVHGAMTFSGGAVTIENLIVQ